MGLLGAAATGGSATGGGCGTNGLGEGLLVLGGGGLRDRCSSCCINRLLLLKPGDGEVGGALRVSRMNELSVSLGHTGLQDTDRLYSPDAPL